MVKGFVRIEREPSGGVTSRRNVATRSRETSRPRATAPAEQTTPNADNSVTLVERYSSAGGVGENDCPGVNNPEG